MNLISRKINEEGIVRLISETLEAEKLISNPNVIDAGCGNGLLGIPIAILNGTRQVYLAEANQKKAGFLSHVRLVLELPNVDVHSGPVGELVRDLSNVRTTLVARGFPRIDRLHKLLLKRQIDELILITANEKCRKMKKGLENVAQKIYNIPFRDNLVICKMRYVSRETS